MSAPAEEFSRRRAYPVSLLARLLRGLVRVYQLIPVPGPGRCRFAPSCSQYAYEALTAFGAVRGTWLACRRISRCHPFHPGGVDPVPQRGGWYARQQ